MTTGIKPTPHQIRNEYRMNRNGHFFDHDTMEFFGDTMDSYGVTTIDMWDEDLAMDVPATIMYRKPSAMVSVFGKKHRTGRDYFGAWIVTAEFHLGTTSEEIKDLVFNKITS